MPYKCYQMASFTERQGFPYIFEHKAMLGKKNVTNMISFLSRESDLLS